MGRADRSENSGAVRIRRNLRRPAETLKNRPAKRGNAMPSKELPEKMVIETLREILVNLEKRRTEEITLANNPIKRFGTLSDP